MASERLQKIMAACGVASRRKAEELIAAGRVTLNGAGYEGRHGAGPDLRGWKTAEGAGAASLFSAAQAERVRDHGQRSGRTLDSDGADKKMPGACVSGGAAGLCQRRFAVDDQRRGTGAEADEGGFARAEDVSGENQRETGGEGD